MDKRTMDMHAQRESKTISTLKTELHRLKQVLAQQAKEFSAERESTEKRVYELQQKISLAQIENNELKTENTSLHASLRKLNALSAQEDRSEKWCATCQALEQRLAADTTDKTTDAVRLAMQELERKLKREQKQMEKALQEKFDDRESELVGENKRLVKQLARANAVKEQNENRAAIAISKANDALIARLQAEVAEFQQQASKHEELVSSLRQQLEAIQSEHASSAKRMKDAEQRVADLRLRQTAIEKAKVAAETEHAHQLSEVKCALKAERAKFEEQEKAKMDAATSKAQRAEVARKAAEERVKEVQRQVTTLTDQLAAEKQGHVSEIETLKSQLKAETKKVASLKEQTQQEQQQLKESYTKKLAELQTSHEKESAELKKQLKEAAKTFKTQQSQQTNEAHACKQALEEALTQAKLAHSELEHQHQELNEQLKALAAVRVELEAAIQEKTLKLGAVEKEFEEAAEKTRLVHESLVTDLTSKHQSELEGQKSEYEEKLCAMEMRSVDRVKELNETYVAALQRFTLQHEEKMAAVEATHVQELCAMETRSADRVKELNETYVAALQRFTLQHEEKMAAVEATHAQTLTERTQQIETLIKERDDARQSTDEQLQQLRSENVSLKEEFAREQEKITNLQAAQKLELDNITRAHEAKLAEAQVSHNEAMVVMQEMHKEQCDADQVEFTQKLTALETSLAEKDDEKTALLASHQKQVTTMQTTYQRDVEALQTFHAQQLNSAKQESTIIVEKAEENARQYEAKITQLTCTVSELTQGQAINTEEMVTYKNTIATLEAACNEITVKFETLDRVFSEFKAQAAEEMKNQLDKFTLAQMEMNQQNEDLKTQFEIVSKAHADSQTLFATLQQKYDEENAEHLKSMESLQQSTQEEARNQMEHLQRQCDAEIKQYSMQLETLNNKYTQQLESFECKYEEEKRQQLSKFEALQTTHDKEIQQCMTQIATLQQEKARYENELESAGKRYVEETKEHTCQYDTLKEKYEQESKQLAMLQQKMEADMKTFQQEKQAIVSQLEKVKGELDEEMKKFKDEEEVYHENTRQQDLQFENLQNIYHATAQQLQKLQIEHGMLKQQLNDNKTQFERLQQTQKQQFEIELNEQKNGHTQSVQNLQKEFDTMMETERSKHAFAIQTMKKEFEQEISSINEKHEYVIQTIKKDFESEMTNMREMSQKELKVMNEHVVTLQQEREELVLSHSRACTDLQTQLEKFEVKCMELEQASKTRQDAASTLAAETQAGHEAKVVALSCRLAAVNAKHLACDGVIAELKEQITKERESARAEQVLACEDLLLRHSEEVKAVRTELESQIAALMQTHHGFEEQLQRAKEQHEEELVQSREDFNETLSNLKERHRQQTEATARAHKQQLSQLQDQLASLQQAYDLTNTQLVEAQGEIKELNERIAKVPEQASKPESDTAQKKAAKEYEAELAKLKKQHSVELMKVSHKVKMEANKDSEIERKQAIEAAEAALEDRLRHEFSRETERLKKEHAKQSEMHNKKLESALAVRRPLQEMSTANFTNAQEDAHLERMVQEANQQNKALQLKRTENPGTFLLGVRRLHLSVIGGVLSVRIGGGFITFPEFVKKYGKDEGQRIFDNAVDENSEWASVSTKYGLDENKPAEQEDDKPKKARKSLAPDNKTASAVKERATKFRRQSIAPF